MDYKVRCIIGSANTTVGKIYIVKDGVFTFDDGQTISEQYTVGTLNFGMESKFELVPDLPRICYILGGEDNPLRIGEKFEITGYSKPFSPFNISNDGKVHSNNAAILSSELYDLLNHPGKIIRQPQFSEDEKAFMRLLVKNNRPWIARDFDNEIYAYESEPRKGGTCFQNRRGQVGEFQSFLLPAITFENSPFNAAEYLEGLK
jgi:hypothetical protein